MDYERSKGILQPSKGVMNDYLRAKEQNMYLIPVGSTGGTSKIILDEIKNNITDYSYLQKYYDILYNCTDPNILVETILEIINNIKNHE